MYFRTIIIEILSFLTLLALDIAVWVFNVDQIKIIMGIYTGLFILQFGIFIVLVIRSIVGDWSRLVDTSLITVEKVTIPMADGWDMIGVILKSSSMNPNEKAPGIIFHHGLTGRKEAYYEFACPLAMAGYVVLAVDARAHGESIKNFPKAHKDDWVLSETTGIFRDASRVIDYITTRSEVDPQRLAMIGHSMGGTICLTTALLDSRIKLVIALSAAHSFKDIVESPRAKKLLTEEWFYTRSLHIPLNFKKMWQTESLYSPRDYIPKMTQEACREKARLVHCQNDELVLFETNALKNKDAMQLPDASCFFPHLGGHQLRGQETIIVAKMFQWLDEKFY